MTQPGWGGLNPQGCPYDSVGGGESLGGLDPQEVGIPWFLPRDKEFLE